jgi:altered-inheritance-of-mitochondria protein 5
MGFASGFTGGVALTLSAAYLSVLAHQRIREQQGLSLRTQALAIQHIVDPIPAPLPPSRAELAAAQRATAVETVKDRWNQEIRNVASWAQTKDWDEVREGVEHGVARLWTNAFGESAAAAEHAGHAIDRKGHEVAAAAQQKAADLGRTASRDAARVEDAARTGAEEAKALVGSALQMGRNKAQELAGRAKAAASIVGDKAEVKADGNVLPAKSAVDKALHQRYESPESRARLDKTVAETLAERYKPVDQRDNTVLRGV